MKETKIKKKMSKLTNRIYKRQYSNEDELTTLREEYNTLKLKLQEKKRTELENKGENNNKKFYSDDVCNLYPRKSKKIIADEVKKQVKEEPKKEVVQTTGKPPDKILSEPIPPAKPDKVEEKVEKPVELFKDEEIEIIEPTSILQLQRYLKHNNNRITAKEYSEVIGKSYKVALRLLKKFVNSEFLSERKEDKNRSIYFIEGLLPE